MATLATAPPGSDLWTDVYNGMAATELRRGRLAEEQAQQLAGLLRGVRADCPAGDVAVRNSRFPDGPALVYTRAEIEAMLLGIKDGEFDHLIAG